MGHKGYLGIDESNNGQFPLIHVGVYSENKEDILYRAKGLPKKRNKLGDSIESILDGRECKYVMVGDEFGRAIPMLDINMISCSEVINAFGDLELVIIDGLLGPPYMEKLRSMLKHDVEIRTAAKGDTTYPVVNLADRIAHKLFKYHSEAKRIGNSGLDYADRLITPKVEDYAFLYKTEQYERNRRENKAIIGSPVAALQKIA
jgi:hypothetical protein